MCVRILFRLTHSLRVECHHNMPTLSSALRVPSYFVQYMQLQLEFRNNKENRLITCFFHSVLYPTSMISNTLFRSRWGTYVPNARSPYTYNKHSNKNNNWWQTYPSLLVRVILPVYERAIHIEICHSRGQQPPTSRGFQLPPTGLLLVIETKSCHSIVSQLKSK